MIIILQTHERHWFDFGAERDRLPDPMASHVPCVVLRLEVNRNGDMKLDPLELSSTLASHLAETGISLHQLGNLS